MSVLPVLRLYYGFLKKLNVYETAELRFETGHVYNQLLFKIVNIILSTHPQGFSGISTNPKGGLIIRLLMV